MKKIMMAGFVAIWTGISFAQSTAPGPRAPVQWIRTVIDKGPGGPTEGTGGIAIGIGRNDRVKRLYCANLNGALVEYTYSGGTWNKVVCLSGTNYDEIILGPARNGDTNNRLYCLNSSEVYEVSYSGVWTSTRIFLATTGTLKEIFMGVGKNDGVMRLYISNRNGDIYEMTYQGGSWNTTDLISQNVWGEALGPGRNDGVNRIYGGLDDDYIYELTFSGGTWQKSTVGQIPSADPWVSGVGNVTLANGQNDGLLRLFYQGVGCDIYYFSYSLGMWVNGSIVTVPTYRFGFGLDWTPSWAIGPGRNDGVNRIYVAGEPKTHNPALENYPDTTYVHEFWYASGSWNYNRISWTGFGGGACVRIGDARNSGKNRVYASDLDGNIVEISYGK